MSSISVCRVLGTGSPRPSCIVSSYVTPAKCFYPATAGARQGSCQAPLSAMCLGLCRKGPAACGIISSYVTPLKCFRLATAGDRQGSCQASLSAMCLRLCLQGPAALDQAMSLLRSASAQPQLVPDRPHVRHLCLPCACDCLFRPRLHAALYQAMSLLGIASA